MVLRVPTREKERPIHTCYSIQVMMKDVLRHISKLPYYLGRIKFLYLWTNSETLKHVTSISEFLEALHIYINYSVMPIMNYHFQKQPPEVFCKKGVLRNFTIFTGKHLCLRLFFNKVVFLQILVFPCEFCEISKNTFFTEHLLASASAFLNEFLERTEKFYSRIVKRGAKPIGNTGHFAH